MLKDASPHAVPGECVARQELNCGRLPRLRPLQRALGVLKLHIAPSSQPAERACSATLAPPVISVLPAPKCRPACLPAELSSGKFEAHMQCMLHCDMINLSCKVLLVQESRYGGLPAGLP